WVWRTMLTREHHHRLMPRQSKNLTQVADGFLKQPRKCSDDVILTTVFHLNRFRRDRKADIVFRRSSRQTGPAIQSSPGSGVTLTLLMTPRCIVGSKYCIACSLRSMMRPGLSGPTSFILTTARLSAVSTSANLGR